MIIFRALQESDLDALCELTTGNEIGVTSLPHEKKQLARRLAHAVKSFQTPDPDKECYYWFLLEDSSTRMPIGVSALITQVGLNRPFYAYKRVPFQNHCPSLNITHHDERLELCSDLKGATELCTLFIHPNARASGLGRFLSRARFLFMGAFPKYFSSKVIAELRGVSTPNGRSPFWEALNRHFFHMSFAKADRLTLETDKQFIADLIPKDPIYLSLLSKAAQNVIGQPHPHTLPAMKILLHEGFHAVNYIDIFDGGPILEHTLNEIQLIRNMRRLPAKITPRKIQGLPGMVATNRFAQFRATLADVKLAPSKDHLMLTQETADALGVKDEALIHFVVL